MGSKLMIMITINSRATTSSKSQPNKSSVRFKSSSETLTTILSLLVGTKKDLNSWKNCSSKTALDTTACGTSRMRRKVKVNNSGSMDLSTRDTGSKTKQMVEAD